MDLLKEIASSLIVLVRAAVLVRVIYCYIQLKSEVDEEAKYKKRIKNVLTFYILAECIWSIKDLAFYYFKN